MVHSAHTLSPSIEEGVYRRSIHPLHAFLLGGIVPFFLSALLSDWAYYSTQQVQWKNFASWLLVGGLVFGGFALLWALIDVFRADLDRRRRLLYFVVLLSVWILAFIDELIHAKDAWATMPEGLVVSAILTLLAVVATAIGFSTLRTGGR